MKMTTMVLVLLLAGGMVSGQVINEPTDQLPEIVIQEETEPQKSLTPKEIVKEANRIFETKDKTNAERAHLVRAYLKSLDIHWLDIDLTKQRLECWEKDKKISSMPISSGKGKMYSLNAGPRGKKTSHNHIGIFMIYLKSYKHLSKLFKVWMYHNLFFHEGHAIHDCRRANMHRLGHPDSHGCVRTPSKQNPYNWAKISDIVFCHE